MKTVGQSSFRWLERGDGEPVLLLHGLMGEGKPSAGLNATVIEPSEPLGSIYDAVMWDPRKIARWMELGERDALRAVSSVRM